MNAQYLINERIEELKNKTQSLEKNIHSLKFSILKMQETEPYRAAQMNHHRETLKNELHQLKNLIDVNNKFLMILGCNTNVLQ